MSSGRPRTRGGHPRQALKPPSKLMSSPHTRGSSRSSRRSRSTRTVVPAHAGVIPKRTACPCSRACRPRTRGGHPVGNGLRYRLYQSSPHTRGSSRKVDRLRHHPHVVPAHAGVIPTPRCYSATTRRRPRTRGGHPLKPFGWELEWLSSPHTRGSSLFDGDAVVAL